MITEKELEAIAWRAGRGCHFEKTFVGPNRYTQKVCEEDVPALIAEIRKTYEFVRANIELANLNTTLIDFVTEVNYSPYNDSDCLSLLESLRSRAAAILQDIEGPKPSVQQEIEVSLCENCGKNPAYENGLCWDCLPG